VPHLSSDESYKQPQCVVKEQLKSNDFKQSTM